MRIGVTLIVLFLLSLPFRLVAQQEIQINFVKKHPQVEPGKVYNLAFFVHNSSENAVKVKANIILPDRWKLVTALQEIELKLAQKKFQILSIQIPADYPVGEFPVEVQFFSSQHDDELAKRSVLVEVLEVEKISLQRMKHSEYVFAGDEIRATYLLKNHGNTSKSFFIETQNCKLEKGAEIRLNVGESKIISVVKPTSDDYTKSSREFYSIRILAANRVLESVNNWSQVFPSKDYEKDLYLRFPIAFSGSYLAVNKDDNFESTYQFQLSGQGSLDVEGKHQLEFLARGPNNTDLSYLGLYDQYYVSYKNKNLMLFGGQKNFTFTPLTESSRYGLGVESRVILNNGLSLGVIYVEPRFYEEIKNEMAGILGYQFNEKNHIDFYYISKQFSVLDDRTQLFSLASQFSPFLSTDVDVEFSRGYFNGEADNAYRINLNTRFSIFSLSGNYYNTGEKYPGYYNNTKFYSGNISARLSEKLGISFFAKRDFVNAQLDTFFVTAPMTESYQSSIDYRIGQRSNLKIFYRQYERKDRLSLNKFHYKTRSTNLRFGQKIRNFKYSLTGEAGRTVNYLLEPEENEQNTYRGMGDVSYSINSKHIIRAFGSWSNINEFVSGKQQNITAGLSISSQISKNLNANFFVQNAYDIDDYYKNRNLMQLNLNYSFLQNHNIGLRSFYTIFKTELEDAEFTLSATYSYRFGMPLKQIVKAGTVSGVVKNSEGEAVEGVWVRLLNETTVTDKNGAYGFDFIQPGTHLLSFEESSFQLDEICNIPNPIEMLVFEEQLTEVDVSILKGAGLKGQIALEAARLKAAEQDDASPANIIVEIKSIFEEYRITTDENGNFSFPLLRPGKVQFKIYSGSIPKGYRLVQSEYEYVLKEGEQKEITVVLKTKKNNIIFKPSADSVLKKGLGLSVKPKVEIKKEKPEKERLYYSIQLGVFSKRLEPNDAFFKGVVYNEEKRIDSLYKYYIGKYADLQTAKAEYNRLQTKFKNLFIVVVADGEVYSLHEYEKLRKEK